METDNSLDSSGMLCGNTEHISQEVGTVHAGEQQADSVHTSQGDSDT